MYIQIVKFKLKPATSREAFLALKEQMISWLKDGFVAYELYEGSEYWSDRIAWQSEVNTQDGLNDFLNTTIEKQVIPLVEIDYNRFFGKAVESA